MPRMTHWNSPEPIDVPAAKAAVYAAQGWTATGAKTPKVQPAVVRETPDEGVVEQPKPAKKAPAKKSASSKSEK